MIALSRLVPRPEIECPGDTITYNCSIQSNSEALQLIWRISISGQMPIDVIYNDTSNFANMSRLNGYITTSLTKFIRDECIESTLVITVQPNASTSHLMLQCFIEGLGSDFSDVVINSSSKLIISGILYIGLKLIFLRTTLTYWAQSFKNNSWY